MLPLQECYVSIKKLRYRPCCITMWGFECTNRIWQDGYSRSDDCTSRGEHLGACS